MEQSCTASSKVAEDYERDGFVVAPKLFTDAECDRLKEEAIRLLNEKSNKNRTVYVGVAAASPLYYKLASDPRMVAVLEKIMPNGVAFLSDKFVFKSGTQRFATPWHIDSFYWAGTRTKLSVWIALDKVTAENGALKVIRGSHKKKWRAKNTKGEGTNGEFGNVIDAEQWTPEEELVCEVEKGGAIFFSDDLVHGSCTNTSGLDRYAIISTYHAPVDVEEEFDKNFPARHVVVK
jgi:phytanoyl-CoA hydroxylase